MLQWLLKLFGREPAPLSHQQNPWPDPVYFPSYPMPADPGAVMSRKFIGQYSVVTETDVIKADRDSSRSWSVSIGDSWPLYLVPIGLSDDQCLDERYWPVDNLGHWSHHKTIVDRHLAVGTRVVWKGTPHDFLWDYGIIVVDGYTGLMCVEAPGRPEHFGFPKYDHDLDCWVTSDAHYCPNPGCDFT